jgi:hypothetical protein
VLLDHPDPELVQAAAGLCVWKKVPGAEQRSAALLASGRAADPEQVALDLARIATTLESVQALLSHLFRAPPAITSGRRLLRRAVWCFKLGKAIHRKSKNGSRTILPSFKHQTVLPLFQGILPARAKNLTDAIRVFRALSALSGLRKIYIEI